MVCGGKELRRLISQITTEYVMIHRETDMCGVSTRDYDE